MKWISTDKKSALDLDKIAYWVYSTEEDAKLHNRKEEINSAFHFSMEESDCLEVYIGGEGPLTFKGKEAQEIYKLLSSQKEVL
jgi:metal-responsive CopG/Arc/MetJ family transcriptional regulator